MRTALIIPTRNAMGHLDTLLPAISKQTLHLDTVLVIDSSSSDGTAEKFAAWGARVEVIDPATFNHGGTRGVAAALLPDADILIYMTQDAIPADIDAFANLQRALLSEDDIGVAYGRQLPHTKASILARHSRAFNYPARSLTKRLSDAPELGIKTCFSSDSFSAYRRTALEQVGGFPLNVIGSEDAYVAGKMLLAGWAVRYAADANVEHSHEYTLAQEFRRYFDIGVFYGREYWIKAAFGTAGGEGFRFVKEEFAALRAAGQTWRIPEAVLRTALKLFGFKLGCIEQHLPIDLKRNLSMFSGYWR
jgi:rhamnosyltransferase